MCDARERAASRGQPRGLDHVSCPGASLRSSSVPRVRLPIAGPGRPAGGAGAQRRILAVPHFGTLLERSGRAAPSLRLPCPRRGETPGVVRLRSAAPQVFLPARQSRRPGQQLGAVARSHGPPRTPDPRNRARAACQGPRLLRARGSRAAVHGGGSGVPRRLDRDDRGPPPIEPPLGPCGADFSPRRSLDILEWGGQSWPQPPFQAVPRTLRGTTVPPCEARRP